MAEKKDIVQLNKIYAEMVRKERRFQKLHTEFSINPHRKLHILPEKPLSRKVPEVITENSDFLVNFHQAHKEPMEKYTFPQTESQEIGWASTTLIGLDFRDRRFNFHRRSTEITKHKELLLRSTK